MGLLGSAVAMTLPGTADDTVISPFRGHFSLVLSTDGNLGENAVVIEMASGSGSLQIQIHRRDKLTGSRHYQAGTFRCSGGFLGAPTSNFS